VNSSQPAFQRPGFGPDTLLFGIGNSGRQDDGLGWAFLDRVEREMDFPGRLEYRYQLQVEDAELVSRMEHVIFVDSYAGTLSEGFQFAPCNAEAGFEFTSHELSPGAVLFLCSSLYGHSPRADLLTIQGSCWGLRIGLSAVAMCNLDSAIHFFKQPLLTR
jgi:hydrogenase maturation protease